MFLCYQTPRRFMSGVSGKSMLHKSIGDDLKWHFYRGAWVTERAVVAKLPRENLFIEKLETGDKNPGFAMYTLHKVRSYKNTHTHTHMGLKLGRKICELSHTRFRSRLYPSRGKDQITTPILSRPILRLCTPVAFSCWIPQTLVSRNY